MLAAAAAQAQQSKAPPKKAARACFPVRSANGFKAPDDRTLYVAVGVRDVWRLDMFGNCFDLDWVNGLALVSRPSSFVCEGDNVDVDVVTRGTAFGRQRCPVTSVRKLTAQEVAALPKKDRP